LQKRDFARITRIVFRTVCVRDFARITRIAIRIVCVRDFARITRIVIRTTLKNIFYIILLIKLKSKTSDQMSDVMHIFKNFIVFRIRKFIFPYVCIY